jgi:integration host factor subunit beta
MITAELVARVATETQLPTPQAAMIVALFVQSIQDALCTGNTVELRGFGRFRCRHRRPRIGRNPKTGGAVQVPAPRVPSGKASPALHGRLNAPDPLCPARKGEPGLRDAQGRPPLGGCPPPGRRAARTACRWGSSVSLFLDSRVVTFEDGVY